TPEVRDAYLSMATKRRRAMGEESEAAAGQEELPIEADPEDPEVEDGDKSGAEITLSDEAFAELASREEFLLSITAAGFGARGSAYDYRVTGRGGQGVNSMVVGKRGAADHVVAVFPV